VFLGIEESLKHPVVPCSLKTDAERARHVRKRVREMLNSRGEWEPLPPSSEKPLRDIVVMNPPPGEVLEGLSQPVARHGPTAIAHESAGERVPFVPIEVPRFEPSFR